jgi:hypothetical protein
VFELLLDNVVVKGKIVGRGQTQKGKRYVSVYDGKSLINVFESDTFDVSSLKDYQDVSISCQVISNNVFVKGLRC